jgi:hypothetical protein
MLTFARLRTVAVATVAAVFVLVFAAPAWSSQTATNGILRITIDDSTASSGFAEFDVSTGPSHPHANETVLYPFGTSYITLRDVGTTTMWTNSSDPSSPGLGGYVMKNLNTDVTVVRAFTTLGATGFRATWTLPNFTIVQDTVIVGTSLTDTRVDQSVSITNTSAAGQQYGLRYMWDWEIAGNDGSFFRTRNPDGGFSGNTAQFNAPSFQFFEEVDSIATPTFSIFGSVLNGSPTPEIVRYSAWPESDDSAWDYVDPVSAASDSSVSYYWGFASPLSLAAGASATYVESISTQQSAVGGAAPVAAGIPGLTGAWLVPVAALLLWVAFGAMRRRERD